MAEPFSFLDKIDRFLEGPVSVFMEVQAFVREMDRGASASDIRDSAMDVALRRLKEPLAEAIYDHMCAVRSEFEVLEGPLGDADDSGAWHAQLRAVVVASFAGSDVENALGSAQAVNDALGDACSSDRLADAVLAVPVADPAAVLARVGVTDAAVDALVAENSPGKVTATVEQMTRGLAAGDWSLDVLRDVVRLRLAVGDDPDVVREAVGYALAESDEDLWFTACEILQVPEAARSAFLQWVAERAAFSSLEQDALDVVEVMKMAATEEGGDSHSCRSTETAGHIASAGAEPEKPTPAEPPRPRPTAPVASPRSALTDAVAGALSVLYEMTKETDTHMAEVLGTTKAVVNQARKGATPWAPNDDQLERLRVLTEAYVTRLQHAYDVLREEVRA